MTTSSGELFPPTVRVSGWTLIDAGPNGFAPGSAARFAAPLGGPEEPPEAEDIHEHPAAPAASIHASATTATPVTQRLERVLHTRRVYRRDKNPAAWTGVCY